MWYLKLITAPFVFIMGFVAAFACFFGPFLMTDLFDRGLHQALWIVFVLVTMPLYMGLGVWIFNKGKEYADSCLDK